MKKLLYILFHRSVFMALALLAQITALAVMVFSFSAYTEILLVLYPDERQRRRCHCGQSNGARV